MRKILLFASALVTLAGCGPFWVNPYVTVSDSKLNWVEIRYYRTDTVPTRCTSVYLNGAGHVEFEKGTSELVRNDFAKNYQDANWSNIRRQRYMVDAAHIQEIFQNLVNHGLLDRDKHFKGTKTPRPGHKMAVSANINNVTYSEPMNIFEADPDLAEHLMDVIREFDNPTL